jgi:hypothetical protein
MHFNIKMILQSVLLATLYQAENVSLHNINHSTQRQKLHYQPLSHKNIHIKINDISFVRSGASNQSVTSLYFQIST